MLILFFPDSGGDLLWCLQEAHRQRRRVWIPRIPAVNADDKIKFVYCHYCCRLWSLISFSEGTLETSGALLSFSNDMSIINNLSVCGSKIFSPVENPCKQDFILIGTLFAKAQIIPLLERRVGGWPKTVNVVIQARYTDRSPDLNASLSGRGNGRKHKICIIWLHFIII